MMRTAIHRSETGVAPLRLAVFAVAICIAAPASAQANWSEGFDQPSPTTFPNRGPDALVAAGWDFRLQTNFAGNVRIWEHNSLSQFPAAASPFAGSDYLQLFGAHNFHSSYWAILPPIPSQSSGDHIGVWVNKVGAVGGGLLELRYSPSGGTATGTAWADVGDFTDVLVSEQGAQIGWFLVSGVVPGQGRLAIRVSNNNGSGGSTQINFDEVSVGPMQSCPGCLPLPTSGQTVHWTLANSPVIIDTSATIVAGGTVVVDPGVTVEITGSQTQLLVQGRIEFGPGTTYRQVDNGSRLTVAGPSAEARFDGAVGNPVRLLGGPLHSEGIDVDQGGTLRLDHADVSMGIHGATFLFQELAPTVVLENSTFTGQSPQQDLHLETGTLFARNCVFAGPTLRTEEVYLVLNSVTFDGSRLDTHRGLAGQPMHLDRLVGINVVDGAPFVLRGSQHHFGPSNLIQGNRWPVELQGGLTPDSVLPLTGNTENVIHLDGLGLGPTTLPQLGLVYEALDSVAGTHCDVLPGVEFRMASGAGFGPSGGGGGLHEVHLRGTPAQPIRFDAKTPGVPWLGLSWVSDGDRAVAEWVELRGAERAVYAGDGSSPLLLNLLLRDNEIGGLGVSGGKPLFRKSRFIDNDIGVTTSQGLPGTGGFGAGNFDVESPTNPCSFEGNTIGAWDQSAQVVSAARFAWWGSSSGPQEPANPGGTGDSIAGPVAYLPFATSAPNLNDTPPSVRLTHMSPRAVGGSRILLHWNGVDDGQIVEYRLEHSPHHGCEQYSAFESGIPGSASSWVIDVPVANTLSSCVGNAAFRLVAIDDAGQEGYDVWDYQVPLPNVSEPVPTIAPAAQLARPGENLLFILGNAGSLPTTQVHVDCEQATYSQGSLQRLQMAPVSTDLVRLSVSTPSQVQQGNLQGFSDYFELRPDPQVIGDFPPSVTLLTPAAADVFIMGDTIPVRWTAADDLGLRSFELQASYDGGIAWHVVAEALDATQTEYDWQLPPRGQAIDDVRLRVIARDTRFQVTSDGSTRVFSIAQGGSVGARYCGPAVPNSSGMSATMLALGSAVASDNDLTLVANGLPMLSVGYFLNSPNQGLVVGPGGSQGNLCLGSSIGRYSAPGQIQNSGFSGRIALTLDLPSTPTPGGSAAVVAGETRNFQAWFRDSSPSGSSNFSDGISVQFQ